MAEKTKHTLKQLEDALKTLNVSMKDVLPRIAFVDIEKKERYISDFNVELKPKKCDGAKAIISGVYEESYIGKRKVTKIPFSHPVCLPDINSVTVYKN